MFDIFVTVKRYFFSDTNNFSKLIEILISIYINFEIDIDIDRYQNLIDLLTLMYN